MKNALPRRTVLRGLGTAVALPFLDAMVPANARAEAPALRLGFFNTANGIHLPDFRPVGGETNFQLSTILTPLEPCKNQLVVVEGLSNSEADPRESGGGPHARAAGTYLNGTRIKRTEGGDYSAGPSIDQIAANVLSKNSPLTSLGLAIESSFVGNCDQGYACAYINTFSWRTATTPVPMENNPRIVFEQLFGDGGNIQTRLKQIRNDRSIIDWVLGDVTGLQRKVGPSDRQTLDEYLTAVRDVETRIQIAEKQGESSPVTDVEKPIGIPDSFDEHAKLMLDLHYLAYRVDATRVVAFQMSREQSGLSFPFIGVTDSHHTTSHHGGNAELIAANTRINTYFMSLFGYLAQKMRDTPDGDGSLLDHSIMMYGSALGDGNLHAAHNLPMALVGGGNGRLRGGRYLKYPLDTPLMNLGLSVLDMAGVEVARVGDSTGRLTGL